MRLIKMSVLLSNYWLYTHSVFEWTKQLFSRLLGTWFITKQITEPETTLTKTERYVSEKQKRFLATFENKEKLYSSNMESCYYDKTKLKEILEPADNDLEKSWKTRLLFETTPRGVVSMYYDPYKMAFAYYADTTSIPYNVLNAVAMKYSVAFFCRDLFVDDEITPDKSPSPLIQIHKEEPKTSKKEPNESLDNAPFARFKNYSKDKPKPQVESAPNDTPAPVKTFHRNRFVCVGKLVNMQFLQPIKKRLDANNGFSSAFLDDLRGETSLQKEVMSYKDFKRSITSAI